MLATHFDVSQCTGKKNLSAPQLVRINSSNFAVKYPAPTSFYIALDFFLRAKYLEESIGTSAYD